jgi:hypothetical protein
VLVQAPREISALPLHKDRPNHFVRIQTLSRGTTPSPVGLGERTHRSNPKRHNQLRQPYNHRSPRPLRNFRKPHIRQIPIQHNPRLNIRLPRAPRHKRMQSRARLALNFRMSLVQRQHGDIPRRETG